MLSPLLIALLSQVPDGPSLVIREPRAPQAMSTSLELSCGDQHLALRGYGPALPADSSPTVSVNGRPLTGAGADQLSRDLANRRALYHFGVGCAQEEPTIHLYIYSAEGNAGAIGYRMAYAAITNGRLEEYRPMGPSEAESFWWR